ncbi:MAG TPA: ScyD/ScyE family protein [Nitrolancea sp.]|nr:ScyD/ScyE family protein [Nitrolancea sp.]
MTYGGLAIFGMPITEEYVMDGVTVQYFERARFEWRQGSWPERFDVQLGLVGNEYVAMNNLGGGAAFAPVDACPAGTTSENCTLFQATGHSLSNGFKAYWEMYGGLAVFGYPISQEFVENGATVQYFERARFEWRAGSWPERFDVQLGLLGNALVNSGGEQPEPEPAAFTVVVDGLNGPFGLTTAGDGSILVADAGTGGDVCAEVPSPEGGTSETCFGDTASILRIMPDGTVTTVVTGLPSTAGDEGASGPSGVSSYDGETIYAVVGYGGDPADRDQLPGGFGEKAGHLFRVDPDGTINNIADISAIETAENPAGGPLDSNPYALLDLGDKRIVVDAGGNDLLEVDAEGNVSVLTTFENRTVDVPDDLPDELKQMLGGATSVEQEPVPNSIALGPDGFYYVGELTGFPFLPGTARIWKVDPTTGEKSLFADGFSNIISVAFGPDGSLYVLEMAKDGFLNFDAGGALYRIAPDGTRTLVVSDGLFMPNGVTVTADGDIYISNMSLIPNQAQIIRLNK